MTWQTSHQSVSYQTYRALFEEKNQILEDNKVLAKAVTQQQVNQTEYAKLQAQNKELYNIIKEKDEFIEKSEIQSKHRINLARNDWEQNLKVTIETELEKFQEIIKDLNLQIQHLKIEKSDLVSSNQGLMEVSEAHLKEVKYQQEEIQRKNSTIAEYQNKILQISTENSSLLKEIDSLDNNIQQMPQYLEKIVNLEELCAQLKDEIAAIRDGPFSTSVKKQVEIEKEKMKEDGVVNQEVKRLKLHVASLTLQIKQ